MFGVFKALQMNLSCENCKNYYSQYNKRTVLVIQFTLDILVVIWHMGI